ncbi:helix-turn-helix transcriptional regulator [Nocardia asteroides]|uniref:helix-turn-helix transcriptional regulator n=1 Tax=Nocardia asteroides TaxID=1824 RepID=UPI00342B849F
MRSQTFSRKARDPARRGTVDPDLRRAVAALAEECRPVSDRAVPRGDHADLERFLGDLARALTESLSATSTAATVADTVALLSRIADLRLDVERVAAARRQTAALAGMAGALTELRSATSVSELFDLAAVLGHDCLGFDRTLVSRVEDGTWRMHAMHIPRDPRWAEDIIAVGRCSPPRLDGDLVEAEVVASARPALVFDVGDNPRVFRELAAVGRSDSYGLAPVRVQGAVVALIHGDQFFAGRSVTDADRAVLAAFAEGFAQALAHVRLLDGLAALRAGTCPPPGPATPVIVAPESPLTRRERDVVRLMAEGAPNRVIAGRLYLSEATVKTHVAHILRKLGAGNRAEAVAAWLRSGPASESHPNGR